MKIRDVRRDWEAAERQETGGIPERAAGINKTWRKKRRQAADFICAAALERRQTAVSEQRFTASEGKGRGQQEPAGASDEVIEGRILKAMKVPPAEDHIRSSPSRNFIAPDQLVFGL